MKEFEVSCIAKPHPDCDHHELTHLGNAEQGWCRTLECVTASAGGVDATREAFYLIDKTTGRRMDLSLLQERGKPHYLRAHADGRWNTKLLELPPCGAACLAARKEDA